jgi:hypothetical protein
LSAYEQKLLDDIAAAETKEKLVLEYLDLCLEFTDPKNINRRQAEIKIRLNEIRSELKIELLP